MKRWTAIILLAAGLGACDEPNQPAPPEPMPSDPVAETVPPKTTAPVSPKPAEHKPHWVGKAQPCRTAPETAHPFPGGAVQHRGDVLTSIANGIAKSKKASDRLMAERAAYLVAIRNAGLYLAGVRVDSNGQLTPATGDAIPKHLRVTDFQQTAATFDPAALTATVTVEIQLAK